MTPNEARDYLLELVHAEVHKGFAACLELLDDDEFCLASGSSTSHHQHHCGTGGLLVHTAEVTSMARAIAAAPHFHPLPNLEVLTVAAIFHDCEKRRDYQLVTIPLPDLGIELTAQPEKWSKTEHAYRIYHVAGSYATWTRLAAKLQYAQGFIDAVGHCILAHHGRLEFGSPVTPQSIEALILHQADMLSATYGAGR